MSNIPELDLIREIVLQHMPEGHHLKSVDLAIGAAEGTDDPQFVVLVELEKYDEAPEPFGWVNKIAKIIRQKWPRDAFFVKLKIVMA